MVEQGGRAMAAYLKPREEGRIDGEYSEVADVVKTLGQVWEYWLSDPPAFTRAAVEPRQGLSRPVGERGQAHVGREGRTGRRTRPARQALRRSRMVDQCILRFPQAGLSLDRAMGEPAGQRGRGLDPHTLQKAEFYVRQIANAISPSNFVLTNPELLREPVTSTPARSGARHAHAGRGHRGRPRQSRSASPTPGCSRSGAIWRSPPAR